MDVSTNVSPEISADDDDGIEIITRINPEYYEDKFEGLFGSRKI